MMEQVFQVELPEWEPKETPQEGREKGSIRQVDNIGVNLIVRLGKKRNASRGHCRVKHWRCPRSGKETWPQSRNFPR